MGLCTDLNRLLIIGLCEKGNILEEIRKPCEWVSGGGVIQQMEYQVQILRQKKTYSKNGEVAGVGVGGREESEGDREEAILDTLTA